MIKASRTRFCIQQKTTIIFQSHIANLGLFFLEFVLFTLFYSRPETPTSSGPKTTLLGLKGPQALSRISIMKLPDPTLFPSSHPGLQYSGQAF